MICFHGCYHPYVPGLFAFSVCSSFTGSLSHIPSNWSFISFVKIITNFIWKAYKLVLDIIINIIKTWNLNKQLYIRTGFNEFVKTRDGNPNPQFEIWNQPVFSYFNFSGGSYKNPNPQCKESTRETRTESADFFGGCHPW